MRAQVSVLTPSAAVDGVTISQNAATPVQDMAALTLIYARPDVYDMEYAGASNDDARFFARLLSRASARAAC